MMNQNDKSSSLILIHHGILGQKWGVRRYQNRDGSLTKAGLKRREKELTKGVEESFSKARHARALAEVADKAEKRASDVLDSRKNKLASYRSKIDSFNNKHKTLSKRSIVKRITENKEGRLENKEEKSEERLKKVQFVTSMANLNAHKKTEDFYRKRESLISEFAPKKLSTLYDDSNLDMNKSRTLAMDFITPYSVLKYGPMDYAVRQMIKRGGS